MLIRHSVSAKESRIRGSSYESKPKPTKKYVCKAHCYYEKKLPGGGTTTGGKKCKEKTVRGDPGDTCDNMIEALQNSVPPGYFKAKHCKCRCKEK